MTKDIKLLLFFHYLNKIFLKIENLYISNVIAKCGTNLKLYGRFYLKKPTKLYMGNNVTINDGVYINARGGITIGDDVSISANSSIVSTGLDSSKKSFNQTHIDKEIIIGNNVQIAVGAIILAGVTIGNNLIVGAGSIVTKDIEDNCIVVGNPAKILRKINGK
jgi:maltose O-acetyltransferase